MKKENTFADSVIKDLKKAQKKEKIRSKVKAVGNWLNNNKEIIIILAPIAIGAITTLVKVVGENVNLKQEQDLKDLYCYDRSLGHYWALRRELTNTEWIEIDTRKQNGERLGDILNEMNVLK